MYLYSPVLCTGSWLCPEIIAHRGYEVTGADRVVDPHPVMVVRIVSSLQVVLVAIEVGFFIDHEAATFHLNGVAVFDVAHQVCTGIAALKMAPREVLVLVENDLDVDIIMILFQIRFFLYIYIYIYTEKARSAAKPDQHKQIHMVYF